MMRLLKLNSHLHICVTMILLSAYSVSLFGAPADNLYGRMIVISPTLTSGESVGKGVNAALFTCWEEIRCEVRSPRIGLIFGHVFKSKPLSFLDLTMETTYLGGPFLILGLRSEKSISPSPQLTLGLRVVSISAALRWYRKESLVKKEGVLSFNLPLARF